MKNIKTVHLTSSFFRSFSAFTHFKISESTFSWSLGPAVHLTSQIYDNTTYFIHVLTSDQDEAFTMSRCLFYHVGSIGQDAGALVVERPAALDGVTISLTDTGFIECSVDDANGAAFIKVPYITFHRNCFSQCRADNEVQAFKLAMNKLSGREDRRLDCDLISVVECCPYPDQGTRKYACAMQQGYMKIYNLNSSANAPREYGSGISIVIGNYLRMKYCIFEKGKSGNVVIVTSGDDMKMTNCIFHSNEFKGGSSGSLIDLFGNMTVADTIFYNNHRKDGSGSTCEFSPKPLDHTILILIRCTMDSDFIPTVSGSIYTQDSTYKLKPQLEYNTQINTYQCWNHQVVQRHGFADEVVLQLGRAFSIAALCVAILFVFVLAKRLYMWGKKRRADNLRIGTDERVSIKGNSTFDFNYDIV